MEDFDTDEPRSSGSSIAAPLIRALLAAAIAFAIYWLVFAQGDPLDDVTIEASPTSLQAATVPPEPIVSSTPLPTVGSTPTVAADAGTQIGTGSSVQVLNGTDDQALMDSAVQTLAALGFDVTNSGRAANDYAQTTVFATAGQEAGAAALMTADPRFTVLGDNPGLTTQINLHVVVGQDWTTDAAPAAAATEG